MPGCGELEDGASPCMQSCVQICVLMVVNDPYVCCNGAALLDSSMYIAMQTASSIVYPANMDADTVSCKRQW